MVPLRLRHVAATALVAALTASGAGPANGAVQPPTLEGRAILPANESFPAPFAGVQDKDPEPAAGATQPVGGFSALLDAAGPDTFWAMPDNGFGSKANSRSFLLRVYKVRADFKTAGGGTGAVQILDAITLRDPDKRVPASFSIVNASTSQRLLTGGDFDLESMRVDRAGDLWFGEEFGPYLLRTDATGRVLQAPIPLPGVRSPDASHNVAVSTPANLRRSNGFEGMAISPDRKTLYPVLEGPVTGDDRTIRRVHEFDLATRSYTGQRWRYRVARPDLLVADFTALDAHRVVALERDNFQGTAARHKRAFVVDLRETAPDGTLVKQPVADLLDIADPDGLSLPGRTGDVGLGDPFGMPYVTIESVLPIGGQRVAIVNDTNFGSMGRNPALPDYSDFIVVRVPDLRGAVRAEAGGAETSGSEARNATTLAVIGDTPYGDRQVAESPALVNDINEDPKVRTVLHVGDIKNGSSTCDDNRFLALRTLYDTFKDPFVYTPGDNEWTDCHRAAAGRYVPTERLAKIRELFFPTPGTTTIGGRAMRLTSQPELVENSMWQGSQVVFSTLHVVGSNNDLEPWFGRAETTAQRTEFAEREAANLAWIDRTFDAAEAESAKGVVVTMQADTFTSGPRDGFTAVIRRLADRARVFGKPVLLLQGDTHKYVTDTPLTGSAYGIEPVSNLQRIVIEGATASEWLRLNVDPRAETLFRWERVKLAP